jgi:hypothetical protein
MFTIFLKFSSCCVLPGASRAICTHFHRWYPNSFGDVEVQVARDPELNLGNHIGNSIYYTGHLVPTAVSQLYRYVPGTPCTLEYTVFRIEWHVSKRSGPHPEV